MVRTATGDPVAEARVLFSRGPAPLPDIATLTDENGGFTLTAPAPGNYELTAAANGLTATQQLDIAPGQERVDIEITLETTDPC